MSAPHLFVANARRPGHVRRLLTTAVVLTCTATLALPSLADPGGNGNGKGNGSSSEPTGTCSVEGTELAAAGLPTHEQLNLLWTDSSGTEGRALGETWDGTFTTWVEARTETTTYEIISVQKGKDGKNYDVYATCTADA